MTDCSGLSPVSLAEGLVKLLFTSSDLKPGD